MVLPSVRPSSFASPKRKEFLEVSSFGDMKSTLERTIRSHHFIHAVDVFLPKRDQVPPQLNQVFCAEECEYYLVRDLSLAKILEWDFIGAFVRTGRMNVLSYGTRIDTDNCVCLRHPGQLVLSLDKDSYEELGLQGKPSHHAKKNQSIKHVVTIDLLAKSFYPGRKLYDRAMTTFEQRTWLRFNLLFCWVPHDDSISRRSLYNYIRSWRNDDDDVIDVCTPRNQTIPKELRVPRIDCHDWTGSDDHCPFPEFIEWLGVVGCDIDCSDDTIQPYISTYECPNLMDQTSVITHAEWRGFFASDTLIRVVHQLRELMTSESEWAAVVVHSYVDVPLTVEEHSSDPCHPSAATYVIVIFPESRYWLCRGLLRKSHAPI